MVRVAMPWTHAILRGQKVLARTNPDGSFASEGGRVEIRYRATDAKAYRASASNLSVPPDAQTFPDDHVVPGVEPPPRDGAGAGAGGAATGGAAGAGSAKSAPRASKVDKKDPAPVRSKDGWLAYTDGACSGNPGPAGSGMIVIQPGGKMDEGFEFLGTSTNNVAELTAILRAIEVVPADVPSLLVHTDSQYSIGVLTKGWKAKANQALIAEIKALLAKRPQVRLAYVPGHAGVPMNERADELAREAIRSGKTKTIRLA
jgi:ribonuclease HI